MTQEQHCGGRLSTVTTVGYGDTFPVTPEGKGMAVFLLLRMDHRQHRRVPRRVQRQRRPKGDND